MKKQFIFDKLALQDLITAKLRGSELKSDEKLEFYWEGDRNIIAEPLTVRVTVVKMPSTSPYDNR